MAINRNALKTYAPKARLDFIQAMKNRAALFGITKDGASDGELKGEVYIVDGRPWPKHVAEQRRRLVARIRQTSFDQVMEAVAYTWFNRFLAIRYMEVHDYFDHGFRVLSSPKGDAEPQILTEAAHLDLPGLKRDEIVKLKLDGTQDEGLYRKILIAQCNDLHRAMPFLFEKIEDETELLLPENLLQSDSIVRKLVGGIDEDEWDQIEIIGWLYQFYISDKKDQVIGKVVKSEDIPAATQLFTPNWIVKYMVQNSLGATWLATYPGSALKGQMEYYIEPAEQTPEVKAQLAAITPKSLDPEALTLLDPAVGSGHILVEAYDLFKAIYIERGYSAREAAKLILTKNLYGLDIDDRAAQMAGFALLMKARSDDRTLLQDPPVLNVRSLQESNGLDVDAMIEVLLPKLRVELIPSGDLLPETLVQPTLAVSSNEDSGNKTAQVIRALLETTKNAKTYGSLIAIPSKVMASLPLIKTLLQKPAPSELLLRSTYQEAAEAINTFAEQAGTLGRDYDCVIANPPYMGNRGQNEILKGFAEKFYEKSKSDTFAMFLQRGLSLTKKHGFMSMVTMESWMFLSSYEDLRYNIIDNNVITSLVHMPYSGKGGTSMGINFGTVATTIQCHVNVDYNSSCCCIRYFETDNFGTPFAFPPQNDRLSYGVIQDLKNIPGAPIAYWATDAVKDVFKNSSCISEIADSIQGMITGNNNKFLRLWHELDFRTLAIDFVDISQLILDQKYWIPYNKGGDLRKWYGNNEYVLNWSNEGRDLVRSRSQNKALYFKKCVTWTFISSSFFAARACDAGFVWDVAGSSVFPHQEKSYNIILGFMCSKLGKKILDMMNPTLNYQVENILNLPIHNKSSEFSIKISENVDKLISIHRVDWDAHETSWHFKKSDLIGININAASLEDSYKYCDFIRKQNLNEAVVAENENNNLFITAYGLEAEIGKEVPLSEITLTYNPMFCYGSDLLDVELEARLKSDSMRELISYAVGCMMGRYSLAETGLIYAQAGNEGFDPSRYGAFPADSDGIVPLTEEAWFDDDAAQRIEEYLGVAWPALAVADNLAFLIDGLIKGHSEDPRRDLRDYLSKKFYPDHLQTYKNRPIYWLFSSGKLKAFECLVYLHRYNEGSLARMRTEYVTPLMGKMSARIEGLDSEIVTSSSTSEKAAKTRTVTKLRKQLEELRTFDEELHHLADRRIALDLDDGVKVNYGKFGDLLAFKTKVCGKDDSE